jgi:hypothetical protein
MRHDLVVLYYSKLNYIYERLGPPNRAFIVED